MKSRNKRIGIFVATIGIFGLGVRIGYWAGNSVTKPHSCIHEPKYVVSEVRKVNEQTNKWLAWIDKELGDD